MAGFISASRITDGGEMTPYAPSLPNPIVIS